MEMECTATLARNDMLIADLVQVISAAIRTIHGEASIRGNYISVREHLTCDDTSRHIFRYPFIHK